MRRFPIALVTVVAAALVAATPALADPSIASKQAEVQNVLQQIQQLDSSLARAIEAYNLATDELARIQGDLRTNTYELHVARSNLHRSQQALADRLVMLYTSDAESSTLGILLGAGSIDEMLNQLETVNRVAGQDVEINKQVIRFKADVQKRRLQLQDARARQQQVVQQRADAKASVEQQLTDRRQLVSSIRDEIQRMKEAERRRQAELARQAAAARAAQVAQSRELALASPYSTSSEPIINAAPSAHGSAVVAIAMRYLGVPYVWAGASPSGFDCSGLMVYVFAQVGITLPHYAASQYGMGVAVARDQLQPGDLVFFDGLGHMGMYVGGGNFIHAPHTGDVVKISSLSDSWYASTYVGARRI